MNTHQPSRPVITPAMREQASKQPNTWLYVVDPIFTDPNTEVPPWGFIGGYRVDERGELTDDFSPNPNYRPSPVALRLPAPTNDVERALQLTTTGYAQGQTLLTAMLDAELILFAQPQGSGLVPLDHESGRRQLQVFTSEAYLPPNWTTWQRLTGRQIVAQQVAGMDLQVNPTSPVKARIPGEELVKAANAVPPKTPGSPLNGSSVPIAPPAAGGAAPPLAGPAPRPQTAEPATTAEAAKEAPATPEQPDKAGQADQMGQPEQPALADSDDSDFDRRFLGSLLAGAIGDALGSAIEFYPIDQIRSRYGENGVTDYDRNSERPGEFTDDTQLTLFTAEGLIRGHIAIRKGVANSPLPAVQLAYQRWLHTQGYAWSRTAGPFAEQHPEPSGWLVGVRDLFAVRSPNSNCISALREFASIGAPGTFERSINDSNDCGGVVRAAPVALWSEDPREVFVLAAATAALTYSNPGGYLPAGVLAVLVHQLLRGESLQDALAQARSLLTKYAGHDETDRMLQAAVDLARQGKPTPEQIKDTLGGGWSGPEALAIAVCAALSTDGIAPAVMVAVNHSGNSDSTGSLCGNIVGARYGSSALPGVWLRDLRQRDAVEALARDALAEFGSQPPADETWSQRYPGERDSSELIFTSTLPLAGKEPSSQQQIERRQAQKPQPPKESAPRESAPPKEAQSSRESARELRTASAPHLPQATEPAKQTQAAPASAAGQRSAKEPAPEKAPQTAQAAKPKAEQTTVETTTVDARNGKILGCLLGGAVGDALAFPIEGESLQAIRQKYGEAGLTDFTDAHRRPISDDTQMTLFTLEGLIRAGIRRRVYGEGDPAAQVQFAYQRWLHTQGFDWKEAGGPLAAKPADGWLIQQKGLHVRRSPGATCVQALHNYAINHRMASFDHKLNDSKGSCGVMRAAPAALWSDDAAEVFRVGAATAVLTHGHPSGYLPAGVLAVVVHQLLHGRSLPEAVDRALTELSTWDGHEETSTALRKAIELATEGTPTPEQIEEHLGTGWDGEQALAIAVCAALTFPESFTDAVVLAANHSGDSDSTAAICGNIMGAAHAAGAVPEKWLTRLELRDVVEQLAHDAMQEFGPTPPVGMDWLRRYPAEDQVPAQPAAEPAVTARAASGAKPEAEAAPQEEPPAQPGPRVEKPAPRPDSTKAATEAAAPKATSELAAPAREATPAEESDSAPAAAQEAGVETGDKAQSGDQPGEPESGDAVSGDQEEADSPASAGEPAAPAPQEQAEQQDEGLSDEELRLLTAWRKFRDGDDDAPADLSLGLHKLLVEAFGQDRAAQLMGEVQAEPSTDRQLAAETPVRLSRGERLAGCVLGGVVGDALGAPWMFADLRTILRGNPDGVHEFTEFFGRRGGASALGQQAVFVFDGLIRAVIRARLRGTSTQPPGMIHLTLQHWLCTQGARFEPSLPLGVLAESAVLRAQRFPDETTLTALSQHSGSDDVPTAGNPPNAARTAEATARGAVLGFHAPTPEAAVSLGSEVAVVTHGHPDGHLPAGALAGLISALLDGRTIADSLQVVLAELDLLEGGETTARSLRAALELAEQGPAAPAALEELGTGWNAPEALAIAVAAALSAPNSFSDAVSLAATHSGNSAATAAICGSLMGAARGAESIPESWLADLELRDLLKQLLADAGRIDAEVSADGPPPDWAKRYLG